MIILGIESSHDDTSFGIVEDTKVLLHFKISQIDIHKKYGGTIPELASREHVNNFYILIEELKTKFDLNKIDKIAYTSEPGLIGSLQIGYLVAHALSNLLNKDLIKINHLHGHIFSSLLIEHEEDKKEIIFPSLALVVSGGHSQIYELKNFNEINLVSSTIDDAIGEAFDKVARVLKLGFPGGPAIDQIFINNHYDNIINFTKPITPNELDFSFSGLKTQVLNYVNNNKDVDSQLVAYSFQKHSIDYLIDKFKKAISIYHPKSIILSGGVSANSYLRSQFKKTHTNYLIPKDKYTTDNGAMIAIAAFLKK
ncbi:MAG: tRNA (adenosine(37)-N6)-threonylcarbamoyltransferase complex transferase subunit TsaD [Metamycoplasmataceae bacterium]